MKELQKVELSQELVLTTKQLAEVYETEIKNIQMNFANNRDKFIEGKHYHLLPGEDLKEFKSLPHNLGLVDKFTPPAYTSGQNKGQVVIAKC